MLKKTILSSMLIAGLAMTGYGFAQEGPKNLKVLPKTLSKPEIKKIMKGYADALGVQCDFCHDTDDMAKDTEHKTAARGMISMTMEINKTTFKGKERVKCVTCHNGKEKPK